MVSLKQKNCPQFVQHLLFGEAAHGSLSACLCSFDCIKAYRSQGAPRRKLECAVLKNKSHTKADYVRPVLNLTNVLPSFTLKGLVGMAGTMVSTSLELGFLIVMAGLAGLAALFAALCFFRMRPQASALTEQAAGRILRSETDIVLAAVGDQARGCGKSLDGHWPIFRKSRLRHLARCATALTFRLERSASGSRDECGELVHVEGLRVMLETQLDQSSGFRWAAVSASLLASLTLVRIWRAIALCTCSPTVSRKNGSRLAPAASSRVDRPAGLS